MNRPPHTVLIGILLILAIALYRVIDFLWKIQFISAKHLPIQTLPVVGWFLLTAFICYHILKGKNWARITYSVIYAYFFIVFLFRVPFLLKAIPFEKTSTWLILLFPFLCNLVGIALLFMASANPYFHKKQIADNLTI